ncbi:MAG: hypothetical protein ACK559_42410, partial [bacterium]
MAQASKRARSSNRLTLRTKDKVVSNSNRRALRKKKMMMTTRKKFREHTTQPNMLTCLLVVKSRSCSNTYNVIN